MQNLNNDICFQWFSPHLNLYCTQIFPDSDFFTESSFSDPVFLFILLRSITLWCLKASSSTEQVMSNTFGLLWFLMIFFIDCSDMTLLPEPLFGQPSRYFYIHPKSSYVCFGQRSCALTEQSRTFMLLSNVIQLQL